MTRRASGVLVAILLCWLIAAPPAAVAHQSDWSYLRLRVEGARLEGELDLSRRDGRILLGLPGDLEGEPGLRVLVEHEGELGRLVERNITVGSEDLDCPLRVVGGVAPHPDEPTFLTLRIEAQCPAEVDHVTLGNSLLFDLDPAHRGYFTLEDARTTHVGTFTSEQRVIRFDVHRLDLLRQSLDYLREGVWHIFTGLDHVLFLVALLLPAPLVRTPDGWRPGAGLAATLREVVKVVSAFTLAHSLTLTLAALDVLRMPSRWVESAIALSVFVAAWNNLRPFLPGRTWLLALGFGLIHGLGFAGALAQVGMPRQALGVALVSFNLGVELGQLAIVLALLPLLQWASRSPAYPRAVMGAGSLLIAWLALVWTLERALQHPLLVWPF